MHKTALPLALGLALALPSFASAQATVELRLGLPVVLPQLVVVSPGVQVVPEMEHEVFFVNGFYWTRYDGGWYRSRSHRGGWVLVGPGAVPGHLVKIPPGKYKHWKGGPARPAPAAYRGGGEKPEKFEKRGKHGGKHGKH